MLASVAGLWRQEHLFALELALESYQSYQKQIARCDEQIAEVINELQRGQADSRIWAGQGVAA